MTRRKLVVNASLRQQMAVEDTLLFGRVTFERCAGR